MARWKARVEFLLSVIELPFLSLAVEVLHGKLCQNSLASGGVGHLEPRFQGKGSSLGNIFGFYKTIYILLSDSAKCTVLRVVVLTQYWRVTDRWTDGWTDGQTDGIAVASTALAMLRSVKIGSVCLCHGQHAIGDRRYFLAPCDKCKHTAHAHQQAASQASTDFAWRHPVWLPHSSLGFQRHVCRRSYHNKPRLTGEVCVTQQATIAHCGLCC